MCLLRGQGEPFSLWVHFVVKSLVNQLISLYRKSWRLEILAESPRGEYYFGPFGTEIEAAQARSGYVEYLEQ